MHQKKQATWRREDVAGGRDKELSLSEKRKFKSWREQAGAALDPLGVRSWDRHSTSSIEHLLEHQKAGFLPRRTTSLALGSPCSGWYRAGLSILSRSTGHEEITESKYNNLLDNFIYYYFYFCLYFLINSIFWNFIKNLREKWMLRIQISGWNLCCL